MSREIVKEPGGRPGAGRSRQDKGFPPASRIRREG
jgi:hypothetical protein